MVRRVMLPAVLPSWVISVRSGLGQGFMFVVAAEFMGASEGLGFLLVDGQQLGKPDQILAAIIVFALARQGQRRHPGGVDSPDAALAGHLAEPALMFTIEHLSKTYSDGTRALADVNLAVEAGEILAVVGGSGCGKTTLLRLVAGLDQASHGSIAVDGEAIWARIRLSASSSRSRGCCRGSASRTMSALA